MEGQSVSWDLNQWRCCISVVFIGLHTCVTRIILFIYILVNQTNVVVPIIVKADAQNPAPMETNNKEEEMKETLGSLRKFLEMIEKVAKLSETRG